MMVACARFHFGQLFLLIISQADGVLARIVIALERVLKIGLGLGFLAASSASLRFAVGFLLPRWRPTRH